MIPGIRCPKNLNLNLKFKSVTRTRSLVGLRVSGRLACHGGYPLGLLGKVFVSPVISPA